jgi:uncharacterized protein YdeI (YjbR/CyaY-like superfamily)
MSIQKTVEGYFLSGCGRCKLYDTPECKVHTWKNELTTLRHIIRESSHLEEEMKWGMPCYTHNKKNVIMLAAFKEYCSVSFFKGALLQDSEKLLVSPGENSQAVKMFRFNTLEDILKIEDTIKAYIHEAIDLEKQGQKITFKKANEYPVPEEFQRRMDQDSKLKEAFYALTPGRQRAYLLHFGQTKQAATRESRIDKCIPIIFSGKGYNE